MNADLRGPMNPNPGHCITNFAAVEGTSPPAAVWTFTNEQDARATATTLRGENKRGTQIRVHRRTVRVSGVTIALWLVTIGSQPAAETAIEIAYRAAYASLTLGVCASTAYRHVDAAAALAVNREEAGAPVDDDGEVTRLCRLSVMSCTRSVAGLAQLADGMHIDEMNSPEANEWRGGLAQIAAEMFDAELAGV